MTDHACLTCGGNNPSPQPLEGRTGRAADPPLDEKPPNRRKDPTQTIDFRAVQIDQILPRRIVRVPHQSRHCQRTVDVVAREDLPRHDERLRQFTVRLGVHHDVHDLYGWPWRFGRVQPVEMFRRAGGQRSAGILLQVGRHLRGVRRERMGRRGEPGEHRCQFNRRGVICQRLQRPRTAVPVSLHAIHHDLPEFALYLVAPGGRPPGNRGAHPLDLSRRELHEAVTRPALAQRIHVLTGKAEAGEIVNPCWFREHACGRDRFTLPQRRGVLDARDEMCGGDADARGAG